MRNLKSTCLIKKKKIEKKENKNEHGKEDCEYRKNAYEGRKKEMRRNYEIMVGEGF